MLHYFQQVLHSIGLASLLLVAPFVTNVVSHTINRLKEAWEVAHELLLIYFRAVEFDPSRRLDIGNVYVRGSGDTYFAEARVNARTFFASRSVDSCEVCLLERQVQRERKETVCSLQP